MLCYCIDCRHWPQFDIFAREALLKCLYKIEVPVTGTVFDHFFDFNEEVLEDGSCLSSFTKSSVPTHSCTSVPQVCLFIYPTVSLSCVFTFSP